MPTLIATGKRIPNYKRVMIPLRDKYSIPLITWDNVPKYLKEEEKKIEEGIEAPLPKRLRKVALCKLIGFFPFFDGGFV